MGVSAVNVNVAAPPTTVHFAVSNGSKRKSKRYKYCQEEKQTMQILSSGKANDANAKRKNTAKRKANDATTTKQTMRILASEKANDANGTGL